MATRYRCECGRWACVTNPLGTIPVFCLPCWYRHWRGYVDSLRGYVGDCSWDEASAVVRGEIAFESLPDREWYPA